MARLVPFGDESGVCAELIDVFLNLLIEAGKQRGDQHDDADPQHHTKYRQGAPQLVCPECIHRLLQIFAVCLCHNVLSVRPKRFNRVQFRSPHGRENSKEETNRRGKTEGQNHGNERRIHGEGKNGLHKIHHGVGNKDSNETANRREDRRFGQKLQQDVFFPGSERTTQTDLPGPFGNTGQHDIHDHDAANDQKNTDQRNGHDWRYLPSDRATTP